MATTYKLYNAAGTDGSVYIDLPIGGKISNVQFAIYLAAGAGGFAQVAPELSRVAVNQVATNNPRGVIAQCTCVTAAASQGAATNTSIAVNEPVRSGERLYLNCASGTNISSILATCLITIE